MINVFTMSGLSGSKFSQTSEIPNGIPPVLLKNFDAYEILKPIIVDNNKTASEELLIDFESPVEVNRSIKEENEGFTVIDLYQNMYVTPQLVNNKPKSNTETDVDFEEFFRKLEFSNKADWTRNSETKPEKSPTDFDFTYFDEIPKNPNRHLKNNNDTVTQTVSFYNHDTDAYQEELIDEVLLNRTLERHKVLNMKNEDNLKKLKVLSTPKISNNIPFHNACGLVQNSIKTELYQKRVSDNIPTKNVYCNNDKKDRVFNLNIPNQANFSTLNYPNCNNIHPATDSNNISNNQIPFDFQTKLIPDQSFLINQHKLCFTSDRFCNKDTLPTRKDVYFNDNRNVNEKVDKSIFNALNISNNVHNNEIALSNKMDVTSQQSHYVSDNYAKLYHKTVPSQNDYTMPTVNLLDNNKNDKYSTNVTNFAILNTSQSKLTNFDHLRELKLAVNDSQSKSFVSDISTLINLTVNPEIMGAMAIQTVIKDNKDYAKNRITKSDTDKLKYTNGPDFIEKSVILPQLLKQLGMQKRERDAKNNVRKRMILYSDKIGDKTGQDQASVMLEPTILTEDCNKERLLALKARQKLTDLVQSGCLY